MEEDYADAAYLKTTKIFDYLLSNPEERKKKGISKKLLRILHRYSEVSPPGWGHTKVEKEN